MYWSLQNQFKTSYNTQFQKKTNQKPSKTVNFSKNKENIQNPNLKPLKNSKFSQNLQKTQNAENPRVLPLTSTRDKLLLIEENEFEPFKSVCHISYGDPRNKEKGVSLLNMKSTGYVKNNSNDYKRSFFSDQILNGQMETETEYRKAYGYRLIK